MPLFTVGLTRETEEWCEVEVVADDEAQAKIKALDSVGNHGYGYDDWVQSDYCGDVEVQYVEAEV